MIIVRVELHSASTGKVTELGRMRIANDGSSTDPNVGNYTGAVFRKPDFKQVTRAAGVAGHRRNDKTIWYLVAAMLSKMGYVS